MAYRIFMNENSYVRRPSKMYFSTRYYICGIISNKYHVYLAINCLYRAA